MHDLKKQLASARAGGGEGLKKCYLLYGEEDYLIRYYEGEIKKTSLLKGFESMNMSLFSGKDVTTAVIAESCETLPLMGGKRLVLIRDSGLFVSGRKDESESLCEAMDDIPESAVIVFTESDVDRRSRLYKKLCAIGHAVEFKRQYESDLVTWAENIFTKNGVVVRRGDIHLLVKTIGLDMDSLYNEIQKLIAYSFPCGEISAENIEAVCSKSLEAGIFGLMDAIGGKDVDRALIIFESLMVRKESPIMALVMIARQIKNILLCKHLTDSGLSQRGIASRLGLPPFVISECCKQAAGFTVAQLTYGLYDCLETDCSIKTGRMVDRLALEMLIVRMTGKQTG